MQGQRRWAQVDTAGLTASSVPRTPRKASTDLTSALADDRLTKTEVRKQIEPWQGYLDNGSAYARRVERLIGPQSSQTGVYVTAGARTALEILTGKLDDRQHYSLGIEGLSWSPGVAAFGPFGGLDPSIRMTVTMPFSGIEPRTKVAIDEKKRIVTVSIEGTTDGAKLDPPELAELTMLKIPVQMPKNIGKQYRIVVRDANPEASKKNAILAQTKFVNDPPASIAPLFPA